MRRDPRSLLELRRLAYRAPQDPGARHVLQDALLETAPVVFERYIEQAHMEDERSGLEQLVWFRPKRMYHFQAKTELFGWPKKRTRWSPVNWFYISPNRTQSAAKTLGVERPSAETIDLERRRRRRRRA